MKDPVREDPVEVLNWTVYGPVSVSVVVKVIGSDVPLEIWMPVCVFTNWPSIFRVTEVFTFISLLVNWTVIVMGSPGHGSAGFTDRSLKTYPGIGVGVGAWVGVGVGWDEVVEVERGEDIGEANGEGDGDAVGEEVGEDDGAGT